MKLSSQYTVHEDKSGNTQKVLITTDEDPAGVTLTVKDNSPGGTMTSFNLPRRPMIEALVYIINKLKTTIEA
jgi:hypothetical protein